MDVLADVLRQLRLLGSVQGRLELGAPWTVASLACTSGMSRSGFAARFNDLVGEPPLCYVTRWRMRRAAKLLLDQGDSSIADIANQVGYESEAAFGVVFKRQFNSPPARWRRKKFNPE
jgi:AraC-like DNA-binding protein